MTRLEAFKVLFPGAACATDGYPQFLPCALRDCLYPDDDRACNANKCLPAFWDEEVKFKFVEE